VGLVGLVRLRFGLGLGLRSGLVIVFNYENVCTTPRLQVHLLLYSGRIDSFTLAKKPGEIESPHYWR